jgi:uridylate kinase
MCLYVISVGGSLIYPDKLDVKFLENLKKFILKRLKNDDKFILVVGGGMICRNYQKTLSDLGVKDFENQDWMGIYSTHLNAQIVRLMFSEIAYPKLICDYERDLRNMEMISSSKILVAGGFKPGNSTDYIAVLMAKKFGARTLINLSNIDYAYDKDPKKYSSAKKIEEINWKNFRKIVGNKWIPGLNLPFDPIASKLAEELNLTVGILNGKDFKNLENFIEDRKFIGTKIS